MDVLKRLVALDDLPEHSCECSKASFLRWAICLDIHVKVLKRLALDDRLEHSMNVLKRPPSSSEGSTDMMTLERATVNKKMERAAVQFLAFSLLHCLVVFVLSPFVSP